MAIIALALLALPAVLPRRDTRSMNACINNLRLIVFAKAEWATARGKTNGEPVVQAEVNQYIKTTSTPQCPGGGTYTYNVVGVDPECSCPVGRVVADENRKRMENANHGVQATRR